VVSSPFRGDTHVTSVTDAATVTVVSPHDSDPCERLRPSPRCDTAGDTMDNDEGIEYR
jgi:hypothetical protein